jgi:hypothetical protein
VNRGDSLEKTGQPELRVIFDATVSEQRELLLNLSGVGLAAFSWDARVQ